MTIKQAEKNMEKMFEAIELDLDEEVNSKEFTRLYDRLTHPPRVDKITREDVLEYMKYR